MEQVQPPAPAECTKAALTAFAPELSDLPDNFTTMSDDAQAKTILANKAADGEVYRTLRATAIRCAPVR